ncbi:MAG: hypothetical protein RXR20_35480, partial [Paraburkholderia sp.]
AFFHPRPGAAGFDVHSKTARRRLRSGGDGAGAQAACARHSESVPADAGKIFNRAPPQWTGLMRGYAPACCGRSRQSVPSSTLAVRLSVNEGWFTDTPFDLA